MWSEGFSFKVFKGIGGKNIEGYIKIFLNYSKWVYLLLSDLFIDSVLILYVIDIVLENKLSKPDIQLFFLEMIIWQLNSHILIIFHFIKI